MRVRVSRASAGGGIPRKIKNNYFSDRFNAQLGEDRAEALPALMRIYLEIGEVGGCS